MTCSGVRQRWIKHAKLISSCYPTAPGETGPKKNELALLVFYAKSKPAKLTKCGFYLERRVAADVRKRKKQDTEVSLAIVKALLNNCNRDINFFSQNILQIIDDCLGTEDIDLVSRATALFLTFCKYHDGSTLGIDNEFTALYENLIDKFAKFSMYKHDTNVILEQKYRSFGLNAIHAVVSSEALYGSDSKQQLKFIIPAILSNLIDSEIALEDLKKNDSDSLVEEDSTLQSRRFSLDVENVSKEENTRLAFHSLKQVFKSADQTNINWSIKPTFDFLEENNLWWPNSFGTTLVSIILSTFQAQDRFLLVTYIIQQLESIPKDSSSATAKQATLVEMLNFILNSDLNLDNLSIGDVLEDLLDLSLKFLRMSTGEKHSNGNLGEKMSDESNNENLNHKILNGLIKSIGGLATHIYYGTQIKDIMDRIIQFMRLRSTSDTSIRRSSETILFDEVSPTEARLLLIRCLDMVIETNREAAQRFPNISRYQVPVEIFQDTVELCLDPEHELRIAYSNVLTKFLEYNLPEETKENLITHDVPSLHFLNSLHLSLYQYALSSKAQPSDHVAISEILHSILNFFKYDQIIRGVPVLFKLQADLKEEKLENFARQRSMASVIVRYFYDISKLFGITELQQYIEDVIQERTMKCQLSRYIQPLSSFSPDIKTDLTASFDEEVNEETVNNNENGPLQPVDVWLDRQSIVSVLCQHPKLKNAVGSDLEFRLMAEWKPEEGFEQVKNDEYRIRVSRLLDGHKPSLSTPIIMTFEDSSTEFPKPVIKVEQLRDALAVSQTINDSSEHDTSVASDLESVSMVSLGGNTGKKKKKSKSKEVNAFLSTIDVKSARFVEITSSLVNPPYRIS
ncbi:8039_t:CDS:10 [Ambispora leptoticha]|uniref:8039_t:CDS:1 n=1 Tax=Ambispora leptoticha TaxID=144679 RepID=A0A9N8VBS6_9GLOM|nr:8039_t:CDS:10 [Ambispora leptoticha]